MPVLSPDEHDTLSRLEKCIRQGDWIAVARLTARIGSDPLPVTADALAELSRRLRKTLVAARVARSGLALSLRRVRAAAGFTHAHADALRQEFGDAATSWHPGDSVHHSS